ncbi:efflux transporter outer membrane subunit [Olivibacter sp. SDN3]|uniref:efflux transporter outer membrane subunit n=1 Tax=Olivibacter sp. SDN3 TaxID=2764720 RepID=UPI002102437C|nr:efflux transporter outer membrane subunit [Olivibacter sp. SDN3]
MNKSTYIILGVFALILTLNACKVGKDYQRPHLELPDKYRDEIDAADSVGIGNIYWKDFFVDSTLQTIIDSAIVYNYDMRKALKNIQIADQQVMYARAQFLPEIQGTVASMNRQFRSRDFYTGATAKWYEEKGRTPPENMFMYTPQNISGITLSWEADIWGKIRRQNESALAQYLQTYEARKLLQTQLVANVAEGYYNLLMLDAQLEVARRNLQLTDSTLRIVRLQRDAGQVTSLAIQQTESQRLAAQSLIPQLERQVVIQENGLRALAGQLPDSIKRDAALTDFLIEDSVTAGVPLYMVSHRPDVRASELALRAANAEVGVAQAYRYPTLTLDATGGVNSMLPRNWVNIPGSLFGGIIGSLTQPIFQRRQLKTDFEVAKLERDKAELDFQQTVLDAINEVTNTLITIKKLQEEYDIAERRVEVAQLGIRQAGLLFKSGLATYLEVITAQQNTIDSELELVSLRQQLLIARVELYRALGGGWQG